MLKRTTGLVCAVALAVIGAVGGSIPGRAAAVPGASECKDVNIAVAMAPGKPKNQRIYGQLCVPKGQAPTQIQVLVHGITYDHNYWSVADPTGGTDRYNYVAAANRAGYATLAVDRIGGGRSSIPPAITVDIDSNAHTMHDVVQAIRTGKIRTPGGQKYSKVHYVGHSFGSWTGWYEATRYNDVDTLTLTGATHHLTPLNAPATTLPNLLQLASADPRYKGRYHDPMYVTSNPGARYRAFYAPAKVDPAVVAADEKTRNTMSLTEMATYPLILTHPLNIRVPVLLVEGKLDGLFCTPSKGGADCSTPASVIRSEKRFLGPRVPSVDAIVDTTAGHMINQSYRAESTFASMLKWLARH